MKKSISKILSVMCNVAVLFAIFSMNFASAIFFTKVTKNCVFTIFILKFFYFALAKFCLVCYNCRRYSLFY